MPLPPLDWLEIQINQKNCIFLRHVIRQSLQSYLFYKRLIHKSRHQVKNNHHYLKRSIFNMKTEMKIAGKIAIPGIHTEFGPILGGLVYIF